MAIGKHRAARGNRVGRILLAGLIMLSAPGVKTAYAEGNQVPDPPSSLNPASLVNASVSSSSTPELFFILGDPESPDTLRYQIQIDDTMDFSSPLIDYISALISQDTQSFTVGQASDGGTYVTGSSGQTLPDSQYYWRVRAIDSSNPDNPYADSAAFQVDTSSSDVTSPPATVDEKDAPQNASKPAHLATAPRPAPSSHHLSVIPNNNPDTPTSSDTSDEPPANAVLNSFASYLDGSGQTLDMKEGQVLFFTHKEAQHSVTLKTIDDGKVTLTIASIPTDITISVGEIRTHDVDNDGRPDISIKLVSVEGNTAWVAFTQLVRSSSNAISVETTQPAPPTNWWWIAGGAAAVALIACLIIRARRSSPRR